MKKYKLTIELVPETCWFTNVRSEVSKKDWDYLRNYTYEKAKFRCEICKGKGKKHPVECHEIWSYDDKNKIQKLEKLVALCPKCHQVKHPGLSEKRGLLNDVIEQLMNVNRISKNEAENLIKDAFIQFNNRSRFQWKLDISYLKQFDIEYNN
jgi:5-methylcytosine-specific restriction endonuclease McrA